MKHIEQEIEMLKRMFKYPARGEDGQFLIEKRNINAHIEQILDSGAAVIGSDSLWPRSKRQEINNSTLSAFKVNKACEKQRNINTSKKLRKNYKKWRFEALLNIFKYTTPGYMCQRITSSARDTLDPFDDRLLLRQSIIRQSL